MIDSHLHLDDPKLAGNVEQILQQCRQNGIEFVINNGCERAAGGQI